MYVEICRNDPHDNILNKFVDALEITKQFSLFCDRDIITHFSKRIYCQAEYLVLKNCFVGDHRSPVLCELPYLLGE